MGSVLRLAKIYGKGTMLSNVLFPSTVLGTGLRLTLKTVKKEKPQVLPF